jgi:hypothetical protein
MVQGTDLSLGRITFAVAAMGALVLLLASTAHGDGRTPHHPVRTSTAAATLVDDCEPFADLPPLPGPALARALRLTLVRDPAARAIPAVWTEYRGPQQPLRGTGNAWIFLPLDGCWGSDTGNFDLRNPSGDEAVRGARYVGISFGPADAPCVSGARTMGARPCASKPLRPVLIAR